MPIVQNKSNISAGRCVPGSNDIAWKNLYWQYCLNVPAILWPSPSFMWALFIISHVLIVMEQPTMNAKGEHYLQLGVREFAFGKPEIGTFSAITSKV